MSTASGEHIVILSPYGPGLRDAGDRRRLGALADSLSRFHDVTLIHWEKESRPDLRRSFEVVTPRDSSLTDYGIKPWEYAAALALDLPAQWYSVRRRRRLRRWVAQRIEEIDPALVLGIQLSGAAAIPEQHLGRSLLDTQNAEALRWQRIAESSEVRLRRAMASRQAASSQKLERWLSGKLAAVLAVSLEDRDYFQGLGANSMLVPNGYNPPRAKRPGPASPALHDRLLFVGSLGYSANMDALRWLADVLSSIDLAVRLTVVGSGPREETDRLFRDRGDVTVLGRVETIGDSYYSHDALIVPIRMGGGSRLKILEAMAHGLPVISTRVGAEGLGLEAGVHYIPIDSSPESWRRAITQLKNDGPGRSAMVDRAFSHICSMTWDASGNELLELVSDLL